MGDNTMESNVSDWKVGTKVIHKDSGLGTITQIDEQCDAFRYLVVFPGGARKWFSVWNAKATLKRPGT